ncbi:MAG: hypothetical protein LBQ86_02720 [Holophagales bacterium]|jgi:CheY-like chemotaxis protein|nr:hypothetical protein [Holophagales bacterium]
MNLFSFGKDKQEKTGNPTVMAYLEDAMMTKCPCMIIDPHKIEKPCTIGSIQEAEGKINLQLHANLIAEKGTKIGFMVVIDNMRIGGSSKVYEVKPGSAVIEIPASFELMERRKKQRAKINPREGTTFTLLSGLFDGIGITGLAENMSEGGARVKVEKALEIKTEKPINITGRTLHTGQIFPIVKVTKIPRSVVTMECGGKLIYSEVTGGNPYIGISFEELKSEFAKVIDNFVTSRNSPLPTSLPPRARRQASAPGPKIEPHSSKEEHKDDKDDKKDDRKEDQKKETKKEEKKETKQASSVKEEPASPAASKSSPAPEPTPDPASATAPPDTADQQSARAEAPATQANDAAPPDASPAAPEDLDIPARHAPTPLQKIKRKGRTIVLFGADDAPLVVLEKMLQAEGYGKVTRPQSMEELVETPLPPGAGLILLDLDMPFEQCLAIAGSIKSYIADSIPLILVSEESQIGVGATLDAQKAGVSLLLPRPLKINDALFNRIEDLMGITTG